MLFSARVDGIGPSSSSAEFLQNSLFNLEPLSIQHFSMTCLRTSRLSTHHLLHCIHRRATVWHSLWHSLEQPLRPIRHLLKRPPRSSIGSHCSGLTPTIPLSGDGQPMLASRWGASLDGRPILCLESVAMPQATPTNIDSPPLC